jgi:hypothetical protein
VHAQLRGSSQALSPPEVVCCWWRLAANPSQLTMHNLHPSVLLRAKLFFKRHRAFSLQIATVGSVGNAVLIICRRPSDPSGTFNCHKLTVLKGAAKVRLCAKSGHVWEPLESSSAFKASVHLSVQTTSAHTSANNNHHMQITSANQKR